MSIINTINPDYDFWEIYPEFKQLEEFSNLRKDFGKRSSTVMWFIVLCFNIDSRFSNMPLEDRVELLGKDYLKDKNFYKENEAKLEKAVELFLKLVDTPARRHKRQLVETLDLRTKFLKNTSYDLDNYDKLDKMVVGTAKILETLKIIEEQLSKEKGSGETKGGHELSLSDNDDI